MVILSEAKDRSEILRLRLGMTRKTGGYETGLWRFI